VDEQDRRAHPRQVVCVAAEVASTAGHLLALIHDVSDEGALLFTQVPFVVGEALALEMRLSPDPEGPRVSVAAQVVRNERMPAERLGVWQWLVGVKFDEPLSPEDKRHLSQLRTR